MDLLIVRHGIAGDREEWAKENHPDHERPLTAEGRARMEENAAGLRAVLPELDLIGTSPFVRAAQTAEVLATAYGEVQVVDVPALAAGGAPDEIHAWLSRRREARIAIIGHEPDLGRLIAWFLSGEPEPACGLKKGGACLLRFADAPAPARAELRWFLPPKLLRQLGT
jgi:phosphohistidine phosphatase